MQTALTSALTASLITRNFSSKPAGPPDESTKFSTKGGAGNRVTRLTAIGGGGGKRAASKATAVVAFCARPEKTFRPFAPSVRSLRLPPEKNVPFGTGRMLLKRATSIPPLSMPNINAEAKSFDPALLIFTFG